MDRPSFVRTSYETPDPFASDAFVAAELRADLATVSPADRTLIAWRVEDGERLTAIADRLGVTRRTMHRRWGRLREELEWAAA